MNEPVIFSEEAALSDALAAASEPVSIRGGGTRSSGAGGRVLGTSGFRGISLYEPGALTMVAGAGTPVAEIEAALAAEKQRLAFEPQDLRALLGTGGEPTIGGAIATNASGPRRVQVGAARDHMLGVRFVDGSGRVISNGGRVMKNVTGYDLVRLLTGSHGTLGVLTEVSFKVLPDVDQVGVLLLEGLSSADAISAMTIALGSPYEVTGAAHLPVGLDGHPVTMLRVEGFETSVAYRLGELRRLLDHLGGGVTELDPDKTAAGWRYIRDVECFAGRPGDVWRIHCRPSAAAGLAEGLGAEALQFDWGGGLIWALVPQGADVRARLGTFDGHARLVRGSGQPWFPPEAPAVQALSDGLRAKFDPRGILNPHLREVA